MPKKSNDLTGHDGLLLAAVITGLAAILAAKLLLMAVIYLLLVIELVLGYVILRRWLRRR